MNKQMTDEYAAAVIECRGRLQTNQGNRREENTLWLTVPPLQRRVGLEALERVQVKGGAV
jgi:hypothetical protein